MNQQNYQFLCETLEGLGMGDAFHQDLKTMLTLGKHEEFRLKRQAPIGKDKVTIEPLFRRSKNEDYPDHSFLNSIRSTFVKENGEKVIADFPVNKKNGFKLDEMVRMLKHGRPVYKKFRGETIGRWARVDSTHPDEDGISRVRNYPDDVTNFRIERHVDKLGIKFANPQEKEDCILDLQSGLVSSQMIKKDGKWMEAWVTVGKQIAGLDVYDSEGKLIMTTNPNQKVQLVADENVSLNNNTQNVSQNDPKNKDLPDSTKQLMEHINNPDKQSQNEGRRMRKAG